MGRCFHQHIEHSAKFHGAIHVAIHRQRHPSFAGCCTCCWKHIFTCFLVWQALLKEDSICMGVHSPLPVQLSSALSQIGSILEEGGLQPSSIRKCREGLAGRRALSTKNIASRYRQYIRYPSHNAGLICSVNSPWIVRQPCCLVVRARHSFSSPVIQRVRSRSYR